MKRTLDSGESSVWKIQMASSELTHSKDTVSPANAATTRVKDVVEDREEEKREEEREEEERGEEDREEGERVTEEREVESSRLLLWF